MNLRTLFVLLAITGCVLWTSATASATTLTSWPEGTILEGTTYTGNLVAEAEGHLTLNNPISKIECASKVEGAVESHGEEVTAGGAVSLLSFTGCTNSWHVTTVSAGSLEVHQTELGNGTVTSSGATIEATRFGVTCRYATSSTTIGTLTGSYITGNDATLDVSASVPFHSGSALCGTSATGWTGSYKFSVPSALGLQNKDPKPGVIDVPTGGRNFGVNEEKEVKVEDQNGPVDWTLDEIELGILEGSWSLVDASKCKGKEVKKAQGFICKVKVKCLGKGEARFRTIVSWNAPKQTGRPYSVYKCA